MDSEKRLLLHLRNYSFSVCPCCVDRYILGFGRIWKLRLVFGEFPWTSITTYKRKTWHRVQASCILVWIVEHFWDRYRFSLVYVCQTWFQFQVSMRLRPSGWQSLNCCVFGVEGFCWWHCYAIAFAGCPWKQLAKFSFVVTVWLVVIYKYIYVCVYVGIYLLSMYLCTCLFPKWFCVYVSCFRFISRCMVFSVEKKSSETNPAFSGVELHHVVHHSFLLDVTGLISFETETCCAPEVFCFYGWGRRWTWDGA